MSNQVKVYLDHAMIERLGACMSPEEFQNKYGERIELTWRNFKRILGQDKDDVFNDACWLDSKFDYPTKYAIFNQSPPAEGLMPFIRSDAAWSMRQNPDLLVRRAFAKFERRAFSELRQAVIDWIKARPKFHYLLEAPDEPTAE